MFRWTFETLDASVDKEVLALPEDMQADFLRITRFLEEQGPQQIGMPHVRAVGGKLWEFRMKGASGEARAIYVAAEGRRLVILHVFRKKTRKTPRHSIELAIKRMRKVTS